MKLFYKLLILNFTFTISAGCQSKTNSAVVKTDEGFIRDAEKVSSKSQCNKDYLTSCLISGLSLTRENYEITPEADKLDSYTGFWLKRSVVPKLSAKSICQLMPNLERFDANEQSIEEIVDNAFEYCTKLTEINLN